MKDEVYRKGRTHGYSDAIMGINEPVSMETAPDVKPEHAEIYREGYLDGHRDGAERLQNTMLARRHDERFPDHDNERE